MSELFLAVSRPILFAEWLVLVIVPGKHALHMFQQNRYELRRYWPWVSGRANENASNAFLWLLVAAPWLALSYFKTNVITIIVTLIMLGIACAYLLQIEKKHKYIKVLVVTARVKRQIAAMAVLDLSLIGILASQLPWQWSGALTPVLYVSNWFMMVAVAMITAPFEDTIKLYYIYLARKILKQYPQLIKIGITGSYGKTSSKNILNEILSERFYVLSTPASYNTPMGITITIREHLKAVHQVFIAEMGADKVGEIDYLTKFVQPQYGIVTSVGPQHLNTFKSIDNIIKEKMKMVENLPLSGIGVLNRDNKYIREYSIRNNCRIVWYGIDRDDVDYQAVDIRYSPAGSSFNLICTEGLYEFTTRLLGKHNIANILASIALARQLGIEWGELQHAVSQVNYVEHRLQLKKINGYTFIDNAFNSNPEGSKMSLEVLKMMPNQRFIVTPGMIDLGEREDELNRLFGTYMVGCADTVILVGPKQTKPIREGLEASGFNMNNVMSVATVKEAFDLVYKYATREDTILLENDLPDAFNR